MAQTFRAGQDARLLIDSFSGSSFFNDANLDRSRSLHETTVFRDDWRARIPGINDGTLSLAGLFDGTTGAVDRQLTSKLEGSTAPVVSYGPEDDTIGRVAYLLKVREANLTVNSPLDGVVNTAADFESDGGVASGVWLRDLSARTSTGSGAGVQLHTFTNSSAGTTGGGVAHLHVTAISTGSTSSATVKVQHSSDGATWADLVTFAASTAVKVQRSTVAGTIKEHLRETCSAFSGTTSASVTYAVAFGRNSY